MHVSHLVAFTLPARAAPHRHLSVLGAPARPPQGSLMEAAAPQLVQCPQSGLKEYFHFFTQHQALRAGNSFTQVHIKHLLG